MNLGARGRSVGCAFAAFVLAGLSSAAADIPKALVCSFTGSGFSSLEDGSFQTKRTGDQLSITYASINPTGGTAQVIGNAGAADVLLMAEKSSLHFLERTGSGNLTLTTVYLAGSSQRFRAVHSRHVGTGERPLVSQYLGNCDAR